MKRADHVLYRAKRTGRNRYCGEPSGPVFAEREALPV